MSLKRALATLPDDRESLRATREIVAFLDRHRGESLDAARIGSAVGVSDVRVESVLSALVNGLVVDCDGDPLHDRCTYAPDAVLNLEVRRFLQASNGFDAGLKRRVDRFRGSYGR